MPITGNDILIAIPTFEQKEYCHGHMAEAMARLPYDVMIVDNTSESAYFDRLMVQVSKAERKKANGAFFTRYVGGQFGPKSSSRERLTTARNVMRTFFLEGDYGWFLSVESDLFPTPSQVGQFFKDYTKGVLAALYVRAGMDTVQSRQIVYRPGKLCARYNYTFKELQNKMTRVRGCPLGMTIIPRTIIEEFPFRYEEDLPDHDDTFFSLDVTAAGHEIWCDGFVRPLHLWADWPAGMVI